MKFDLERICQQKKENGTASGNSQLSNYDYELAKMAVSPKAQGKGVGWLLGKAIVEKAKSLGAKKLYLESNTILTPAINLYLKMGFKKIAGYPTPSPYERSNIQMELDLLK